MTEPAGNPLQAALENPARAPELALPGDRGPELAHYERPPFPPDCPVKPLGMSSGIDGSQRCFYLDCNGQLVGLDAGNRHGKNSLIALFGQKSDWLEANFPQWSKPVRERDPGTNQWVIVQESVVVGFDQARASRAMIEECARQGIFEPAGRLRGRGAHRLATVGATVGAGRGLVLHCGDKLLVSTIGARGQIKDWRWIDPGRLGQMVYTAGEPIPRPHYASPAPARPAERLLGLLMTWPWKRPLLDARFALGALALGPFGGAASWRSHVWITGGKGTGKSSLNGKDGLVHRIFGEGVFRTANTSAAGLRQSLKNSTVPVMIDEFEASRNNDRVQDVIELARISSSGDDMTRGSQDHTAQSFTLQSCFWCSSINIPPLSSQDRSRYAILELNPLPRDAAPLDLDAWDLAEIGGVLMRRMVDGWERLEATFLKFKQALAAVGHDPRACDQFGMLLAAADIAIQDHPAAGGLPDDEEVNHWASLCRPQRLAEVSDATPDHQDCVNHLVTHIVQARGGDEREALGTWIGGVVAHAVAPLLTEDARAVDKAGGRLQQLGLKLVNPVWHPAVTDELGEAVKPARWGAEAFVSGAPGFLAVAGKHQALAAIFEKTAWQGGVWYQSLKRNDGAIEGVKVKFGHSSLTAVLVPLAAVLDDDELPAASKPAAAAAWIAAQAGGGAT